MNILIIDNSVAFTGAFKCALNEAELLSDKHHFVFVLPAQSTLPPILKEKGYTVYTLPMAEIKRSVIALIKYPFILFWNTQKLKAIVKKEAIDLVQMNDFYNLLGTRLKKMGYKGKLITYVRFLPSVIPAPLRMLWTKKAIQYSDAVVAVSDAVKNQMPELKKITRIYDPVMLEEKLPAKEYNNQKPVKLLYLANYIIGKGHEHALKAFAIALKENPDMHLTFMGGDMGLEKNKAFRLMLKDSAKNYSISHAVTFSDFDANVERAIKSSDIVLNFSESESFSMTCLEAAFYGTPLIATRCGGPEEIIQHNKTGLLVNKGDTKEMSNAILQMANNPEQRIFMALAGKSYVRQKFSTEKFVERFEQLIATDA